MSEEELQAVSGLSAGAAGGGTDGRAASEANGETDEEAADSGRTSAGFGSRRIYHTACQNGKLVPVENLAAGT